MNVKILGALLAPEGARVQAYDLPAWRGPDHVLHLMSVGSLVADDLARAGALRWVETARAHVAVWERAVADGQAPR